MLLECPRYLKILRCLFTLHKYFFNLLKNKLRDILFAIALATLPVSQIRVIPLLFYFIALCLLATILFWAQEIAVNRIRAISMAYCFIGLGFFFGTRYVHEASSFLLFNNMVRLLEVNVAFICVRLLFKELELSFKLSKIALLVILVIGVSFIVATFDSFEIEVQVVVLLRMIQTGLLAAYVLFNKRISILLTGWILLSVLSDFFAGLRIAGIIPIDLLWPQEFLLCFSFYFFVRGVLQSLQRQ